MTTARARAAGSLLPPSSASVAGSLPMVLARARTACGVVTATIASTNARPDVASWANAIDATGLFAPLTQSRSK